MFDIFRFVCISGMIDKKYILNSVHKNYGSYLFAQASTIVLHVLIKENMVVLLARACGSLSLLDL